MSNEPTDIEQLNELKRACEEYLAAYPTNRGAYPAYSSNLAHFRNIRKDLRDGVVFYSGGWGWRLRREWRKVLDERIAQTEKSEAHKEK